MLKIRKPGGRINGAQRRLLAESLGLLGLAMLAPLCLRIIGQPVSAGAVLGGLALCPALLGTAVWLLADREDRHDG